MAANYTTDMTSNYTTDISVHVMADCSVLVVDDDATSIQIIHKILRDDYKVLMATSSKQAIEVCKRNLPDLVLLDVMMPDINGLKTCEIMKQDPQTADIPIMFVTSLQSDQDEEDCWNAGAVDFIQKPIKAMTLINRVKSHVIQKKQADLLRSLAFIDGLTSINNRRYFDERLKEQVALSARNSMPFALLLVDIDRFKHYNDAKGHLAGDDTLRIIALQIKMCSNRPSDTTARYGGEEFAVILPDTDAKGAVNIADNILSSVNSLCIPHPDSEHRYVSVSIGIAYGNPSTSADMIKSADEQLYLAKSNGRNCYSIGQ